jgi:uncharacterized protein
MNIQEELRSELKDAMRQRDRRRIDVIRQVESEVSLARSAPGFRGEIDDDLYRATIASYVKKMDKARAEFVAAGERGRDQAEKLAFEVEYLGRWLPEQRGEEETRALVREVIAATGVTDPKLAGTVIGQVMRSADDLDGALVNRLVREELGAG